LRFELQASGLDAQRKENGCSNSTLASGREPAKFRDMDVLTAHLSTLRVDGERDCLIQLFEYLGTKRYEKAERLYQVVNKYRDTINKRLKKIARVLEKRMGKSRAANAATSAAMQSSAELATYGSLNRGNLQNIG